ncbi:pirin family protein [Streptomyces lonarensis]|uniref:Pirin family protein n=2 Tax=Streptomyces lonarensis TaxID=700599 RepID=A0A7X6D587_9ACTN|nr:pirin family protein [Streptomyces lonarensis]NJQ08320.1 pirin family protein [Streptomyces lonarensis]
MPAITVENPLTLPAVAPPAAPEARPRPVLGVVTAPTGFEGEGFPVRRAFAGIKYRHLDPFIMMDQMGEVEYAPGEPKGTPWHPHRGFETVTYLMDGTFVHQDSEGGGGVINDGDTQWMTAGSGLLHIEAPPEKLVMTGGLFHGIQLWVNLPAKDKMTSPRYQDIGGGNVKLLTTPDGGGLLRLIAGDLDGHSGPGVTHTPITLVHATVSPGAEITLPWQSDYNGLAYVLSGRGSVGTDHRPVELGQTAVFGDGDSITVRADDKQDGNTPNLEVILLGGRPIREPMAHYGPFVMNSQAELRQAFEDFQAGRLGRAPGPVPHTTPDDAAPTAD